MADPYTMPPLTKGDKMQAFYQALIAAGGALTAGGAPSYQPGGVSRANPGGVFMQTMNARNQAARLRQLQGLKMAQSIAKAQQDKTRADQQTQAHGMSMDVAERQKSLWPAEDAALERSLLDAARERTFLEMGGKDMAGRDAPLPPSLAKQKFLQDIKYRSPERVTTWTEGGNVMHQTGNNPPVNRGPKEYYPPGHPSASTTQTTVVPPPSQALASAPKLPAPAAAASPVTAKPTPAVPSGTVPQIAPSSVKLSPLARSRMKSGTSKQPNAMGMYWDAKQRRMRVETDESPEAKAARQVAIQGDKALMKVRTDAIANLPRVVKDGQVMIDKLKAIRDHPNLEDFIGRPNIDLGDLGRTAASLGAVYGAPDFLMRGTQVNDLKQLVQHVTDKSFLEAFQELKGGGQITEKEGDAARNAASQLAHTSMTEEAYKSAINDFIQRIEDRIDMVKVEAGVYDQGASVGTGVDTMGRALPTDLVPMR